MWLWTNFQLQMANRRLRVTLMRKSSQELPIDDGFVPQGFVYGISRYLLSINDLPGDVICYIAVYTNTTLS